MTSGLNLKNNVKRVKPHFVFSFCGDEPIHGGGVQWFGDSRKYCDARESAHSSIAQQSNELPVTHVVFARTPPQSPKRVSHSPAKMLSPPRSPIAVAARVISLEESVRSTFCMKRAAKAIALEDEIGASCRSGGRGTTTPPSSVAYLEKPTVSEWRLGLRTFS